MTSGILNRLSSTCKAIRGLCLKPFFRTIKIRNYLRWDAGNEYGSMLETVQPAFLLLENPTLDGHVKGLHHQIALLFVKVKGKTSFMRYIYLNLSGHDR